MFKPFRKLVIAMFAACAIVALPIVAIVSIRVHDAQHAIAQLQREQIGLTSTLLAYELLVAVERYRITQRDSRPELVRIRKKAAAAISASINNLLASPNNLVSNMGPRTSVTLLSQRWEALLAISSDTERERETLPLAEEVLTLLLDIDDVSGLTYDSNVDSINLTDALAARLPSQSERRDQAAEIVELSRVSGSIDLLDVIHAERSSGEAHDALGAALDDFDGAVEALPAFKSSLSDQRAAIVRESDRLTAAVDALILEPTPARYRLVQQLRLVSVDESERLFGLIEHTLWTAFESRIATYAQSIRVMLALGAGAAIVTSLLVAALSIMMRRRHQAELARANERAEALETKLAARNAERALRLTEQHFRAVFDSSLSGIAIIDRSGRRIDPNGAFRTLFDNDFRAVIAVATLMIAELERASGSAHRAEHRFEIAGRPPLWTEVSVALIRGEGDDAVSAIVMVHDITIHKSLHEQLDHQTLHDALTGLPNRVYFMRRLEALIAMDSEPFAVVFIDLDHFKAVNDTMGHHAGDRLLCLAAHRLTESVRPSDFVARLHGDEFALLLTHLPHSMGEELHAIVTRVQQALCVTLEGQRTSTSVSASIGVVRSSADRHDAERYLRQADAAMYHSKLGGRGCTTFYDAAVGLLEPQA